MCVHRDFISQKFHFYMFGGSFRVKIDLNELELRVSNSGMA